MSIVGHGIDLVDIAEMRRWIDDPRDPLIPRCFVQEELDEVGDGPDRTERLGTDAASVVDPELRVHGVPHLRVADASIMPMLVSGNTNAPSVMIGERCADFLLRTG